MAKTISEILKELDLKLETVQIVHEDDGTYHVENMKNKVSMTRGAKIAICDTKEQVVSVMTDLKRMGVK